jgi:hypothetical protein
VKLENEFDTDVCFQPFPDWKGITMPYVVVHIKAEIPVVFNNASLFNCIRDTLMSLSPDLAIFATNF